jgi:integral membrane protein (TIGR01906 family)
MKGRPQSGPAPVKAWSQAGAPWLISLLTPVALLGLALRLLLTPVFLQAEYRMPYFPPDQYGFTLQDRLRWGPYGLNFVLKDVDRSYLADLKFEDGAPLFNSRELSHMQDVQRLTHSGLCLWYVTLALLLGLGAWARAGNWLPAFLEGLWRGGWLMVGLAAALGLLVGVGMTTDPDLFWGFFTAFHGMFFSGDSWLFEYSDTLIRLYPIRFWQDAFLAAALIVLGSGLGLALGFKPKH